MLFTRISRYMVKKYETLTMVKAFYKVNHYEAPKSGIVGNSHEFPNVEILAYFILKVQTVFP
jgi:hypothetical protein